MPNMPLGIPSNLDKYFFNRKKELAQLNIFLSGFKDDIANQLLVTGRRGVGKSFLLLKLKRELPDNVLSAYLDLSKIHGIQKGNLTEEKVMHSLFEAILNSLEDKSSLRKIYNLKDSLLKKISPKTYDFKGAGNLLGIPLPRVGNDYEKLSSLVMEFPQNVVDNHKTIDGFVIILDEFQLIGEFENPEAFFWLIRSYTQHQDNVTYIFTGSTSAASEIVDQINGAQGAFGGRMIQFPVEPFSEEDTYDYLKEMIPEIKFTPEGLKRFYRCTGGYPSYINSFCNTMSGGRVYDNQMVIETFYSKLDQIAIMWVTIWSSLSDYEKEIIKILVENGALSWSELLSRVDYSNKTLLKYTNRLKNKGILSHIDRNYTIDDMMLRSWLKYRQENDGYYPP
ncbi:MAG: ATP-binding protein [Methanobacterium sp.]|uniref:AAA family ATPase n=1 Tax=Methanobacterium sp. TaxID=2164 RepID=UPI00258B398C|nr:ATP-binding protein [Methanobacterium sp.]MCC7560880.1 ATP-binding protein [Methanobacterium sp.]